MEKVPSLGPQGSIGHMIAYSVGTGLRTWFAKAEPDPMPKHWVDMIQRIEFEQPLICRLDEEDSTS